jgi:hypothetical protein
VCFGNIIDVYAINACTKLQAPKASISKVIALLNSHVIWPISVNINFLTQYVANEAEN